MIAARAAADKKGEDTLVLDVGDIIAITEVFVITSGSNTRQVRTICDEITVLLQGRKVDACLRSELAVQPRAPYTNLLVDSVPELRLGWLEEACRRIDERAR